VLEQNLGRWAQVYLTSAPEDRDHAVEELLRELKAQRSTPGSTPQPPRNLQAAEAGNNASENHDRSERQENHDQSGRQKESDLDWLRSKNLSLAYEQDSGPRWIWKVAAPILALVVVGFLYSQWKTRLTAEQHPIPAAAPPQQPQQQLSSASPEPLPSEPASNPPHAAPNAAAQTQPSREATPAAPGRAQSIPQGNATAPKRAAPVMPPAGAEAQASPVSTDAAGRMELSRAQDYLEGRNGPRDTVAAADWLWRAVRRENTAAEVLLADLYLRGDGVPKSCEQARLLLVAAAKRGQSEAAGKLRNLESGSCP
jgi:hypothetical protein